MGDFVPTKSWIIRGPDDGVDCAAADAAAIADGRPEDAAQTVQADAKDADINNIMKRYERTGQLPDITSRAQAVYGDATVVPDFQTAQNVIVRATQLFEQLPAKVRERFGHSPARFLDFVGNPKNQDEMIELGLATRKASPAEQSPAGASVPPDGGTQGAGGVSPPAGL